MQYFHVFLSPFHTFFQRWLTTPFFSIVPVLPPALLAALITLLPLIGVPLALSAFLLMMRFLNRDSPLPDLMVFLGASLLLSVLCQF